MALKENNVNNCSDKMRLAFLERQRSPGYSAIVAPTETMEALRRKEQVRKISFIYFNFEIDNTKDVDVKKTKIGAPFDHSFVKIVSIHKIGLTT